MECFEISNKKNIFKRFYICAKEKKNFPIGVIKSEHARVARCGKNFAVFVFDVIIYNNKC